MEYGQFADKRVHPSDGLTGYGVFQAVCTVCRPLRQRGCAGIAVNRRPNRIAAQVGGVGEEQEGAACQRRVHKVFTRTAEYFFRNHNAERNTQSRLPQRQRGRND